MSIPCIINRTKDAFMSLNLLDCFAFNRLLNYIVTKQVINNCSKMKLKQNSSFYIGAVTLCIIIQSVNAFVCAILLQFVHLTPFIVIYCAKQERLPATNFLHFVSLVLGQRNANESNNLWVVH